MSQYFYENFVRKIVLGQTHYFLVLFLEPHSCLLNQVLNHFPRPQVNPDIFKKNFQSLQFFSGKVFSRLIWRLSFL